MLIIGGMYTVTGAVLGTFLISFGLNGSASWKLGQQSQG